MSFFPLQLSCQNEEGQEIILWINLRYSSTRFCRPVQFEFTKETAEKTVNTVKNIEDQIKRLHNTCISDEFGKQIYIKHTLILSMVDGKVKFFVPVTINT